MEVLNYLFHNTFFLVMLGLFFVLIGVLIYLKALDRRKGHSSSGEAANADPHEGGDHASADDHHHKVESRRAFIAKMFALVLTFATLVVIAIVFIQAYKEVSLDKDDDKVAKEAAQEALIQVSNRVSFRIPAGDKGKTIQFRTSNGFRYDQSYIYNPDDAYKVTIVTSKGRRWDDGPDKPRGEAIGPKDWPITVISRQGEIPVFSFERAGKYNK